MEHLNISKKDLQSIYRKSEYEVKDILESIFNKEDLQGNIMDRVTNYNDALVAIGRPYNADFPLGSLSKYEQSVIKLYAINKALNEGWSPKMFSKLNYAWIPRFDYIDGKFSYLASEKLEPGERLFGYQYMLLKSEELARYSGTQFIDMYENLKIL